LLNETVTPTGTRREINKIVERILRDSSLEPPIDINEILAFLKLHRDFYSLDEPGLLKKFAHRIQIGTNKAINVIRDKVVIEGECLVGNNLSEKNGDEKHYIHHANAELHKYSAS
jgi:hypothetical protein